MELRRYPDKQTFVDLARRGNVVPVCLELLADTETPVSALAKLYSPQDPVFLLESVEGGERWGRYSFLGTSARSHVKVFPDRVELREGTESRYIAHFGDPLQVLRSLMARFRPVPLAELPRFWGGLVGYLTYEMVSFFERIPHSLPERRPLAHFVLSDEIFIFDNVRHTLTLVAPAFLEDHGDPEAAYSEAVDRLERMSASFSEPLPAPPRPYGGDAAVETVVAPELFRSKVAMVKEHIEAGDIIQAVISQPFVCKSPPDPLSLYRVQRHLNPSPYMFFLQLDDVILVGSSPETMVRLEQGTATLRPIAGTRPRGHTEQEDRRLADELLQDPKERAEHVMLVDLGRNDLGRVAEVGTVQVTDLMVVERYSHVMHLVSNIICEVRKDCDAWDLLRATFPAGTLSGAPKVRAMEIIAQMEESPRGPYGGAVGYVSYAGNMDLAITIRTACFHDAVLTVRAGGGVVADSDPETERQETINKAKAIEKGIELVRRAAGSLGVPRA